jgi:hypothetical protein
LLSTLFATKVAFNVNDRLIGVKDQRLPRSGKWQVNAMIYPQSMANHQQVGGGFAQDHLSLLAAPDIRDLGRRGALGAKMSHGGNYKIQMEAHKTPITICSRLRNTSGSPGRNTFQSQSHRKRQERG